MSPSCLAAPRIATIFGGDGSHGAEDEYSDDSEYYEAVDEDYDYSPDDPDYGDDSEYHGEGDDEYYEEGGYDGVEDDGADSDDWSHEDPDSTHEGPDDDANEAFPDGLIHDTDDMHKNAFDVPRVATVGPACIPDPKFGPRSC